VVQSKKLRTDFSNCVYCKACDIKDVDLVVRDAVKPQLHERIFAEAIGAVEPLNRLLAASSGR
jgi:hypothetical protein